VNFYGQLSSELTFKRLNLPRAGGDVKYHPSTQAPIVIEEMEVGTHKFSFELGAFEFGPPRGKAASLGNPVVKVLILYVHMYTYTYIYVHMIE